MKPEFLTRLKSQLDYSPATGEFRWLVSKNSFGGKVKAGCVAGSNKDGYVQIICDQRQYRGHRLAWLLMTGSFPPKGTEIDHINRNRSDNRWCNLRLAKRSQNNMNSGNPITNTSGQKGVHRSGDGWFSRIQFEGKVIHLGSFSTFDDAVAARKDAEKKYFGEFAK